MNHSSQPTVPSAYTVQAAGLVLINSYLPFLFRRCALLLEGEERFRDRAAAARGVALLQFAAMGVDAPGEHELALHKMLCGLPPAEPLACQGAVHAEHKELVVSMLQAFCLHWKDMANNSVDGLRACFLLREGRLLPKGDAWMLHVDRRPFDLLLATVPSSYSIVRYRWMANALHVLWRH
jgi:hypothetical protein